MIHLHSFSQKMPEPDRCDEHNIQSGSTGLILLSPIFVEAIPLWLPSLGQPRWQSRHRGLPLQRPTLKRIHKFNPIFFAFRSVLNVGIKLYLYVKKHIFVVVLEGGTDG